MYEKFFAFREKPFSLLPDPAYLYLSKQHEMAMALLEYSLENKAGFCALSGPAGVGKTTLLRRLLNQIGGDVSIGLITNTHDSFDELMRWILHAFDLTSANNSRAAQYQVFVDFLIARYARNQRTILIIDEAQNLSAGALEELRMLSNINTEKDLLVQVILVGQPPLRAILRRPELEQFAQRIAMDYHLVAFGAKDTRRYIRHRLVVAGGEEELFTDDACDAVFNRCRGIPRLINLLCDYALVYAYAEQSAVVTGELIEQVARERETLGALPVLATKSQREQNHAVAKTAPVPARKPNDAARRELNRKPINASPAAAPTMPAIGHPSAQTPAMPHRPMTVAPGRSAAQAPRQDYSTSVAGTSLAATDARASRLAAGSQLALMASCSSLSPASPSPGKVDILRQVNGTSLFPLFDTASEDALSLVEVNQARAKSDPSNELLEKKRSILWGTLKQTAKPVPAIPNDATSVLPPRQPPVDAAPGPQANIAKRLDWLAEMPNRDAARYPIKRFLPEIVIVGLLLVIGVIWGYFRFAPEKLGPAPAAATANQSAKAPAVAPVSAKILSPNLDPLVPPKAARQETRVSSAAGKSADKPIAEKPVAGLNNRQMDIKIKRMQRERDAALALSKTAAREREAALAAAKARERTLAAQHEANLARERERANQLAQETKKAKQAAREAETAALLAQQKRFERVTPPQVVAATNTVTAPVAAAAKPPTKSPGTEREAVEESSEPVLFKANPCKGPSARFLSTCN